MLSQSIMFQNEVGTVVFLSPLFSYFFNRQIMAGVLVKRDMIDAESLKQMERRA